MSVEYLECTNTGCRHYQKFYNSGQVASEDVDLDEDSDVLPKNKIIELFDGGDFSCAINPKGCQIIKNLNDNLEIKKTLKTILLRTGK